MNNIIGFKENNTKLDNMESCAGVYIVMNYN